MKTFLPILLFCLLGCETQQERVRGFVYIKDSRTNLCFATYELGGNQGLMTNVPCSGEVETAIFQDKQRANTER
jgi:hypothetical protein